jgi:hypothetical protein
MVHRIFKAWWGADACGLFEIDLQCGFCAVVKAHMPPWMAIHAKEMCLCHYIETFIYVNKK